jgi:hypothetical protein
MHQNRSQLNAPRHQAPRYRPRRRFGTRRTQRPAAWIGHGTAWLVHDADRDCYHCYWLVGPANGHLVEHADAPNAGVAVEWARSRTPRARIRLPDHRTYWAGTDPAPAGFAGSWTAAIPTTTPLLRHLSPESPLPWAVAETA